MYENTYEARASVCVDVRGGKEGASEDEGMRSSSKDMRSRGGRGYTVKSDRERTYDQEEVKGMRSRPRGDAVDSVRAYGRDRSEAYK